MVTQRPDTPTGVSVEVTRWPTPDGDADTRHCERCQEQPVGIAGRCVCGSASWADGRKRRFRNAKPVRRPKEQLAGQVDIFDLLTP